MKKRVLGAALAAMMTASAAVPCTADSAPAVGSVIGSIYSTDILTYVSGASIRGYALDGKTAIHVEDLANYGFVVGYNDSTRTLYAFVKSNTYPFTTAGAIDRGKVGEIVGSIYASDIKTYINGVLVPSFTLDGKTAVAIEDIAADETTDETKKTCMTYKWNGEMRTITLNPVYNNTAKVPGGFSISETGVVTYDKSAYTRSSYSHSVSALPEEAYAFPLHFGSEDGEIVGKAYGTAVTCPDQNETGDNRMRTYTCYTIDWDYEKLDALYDAWQKSVPDPKIEDLKANALSQLSDPKIIENDGAVVLADKKNAIVLLKENDLYTAQTINVSEYLAYEGMANGVVTAKTAAEPIREILGTYQNKDKVISLLILLEDGSVRTLYVDNAGTVQAIYNDAHQTKNYGTVYPVLHSRQYVRQTDSITIDGKNLGEFDCYTNLGGQGFYVPLKPILDAVGGSAKSDGLTLSITTDGKEHTYFHKGTDAPMQPVIVQSFHNWINSNGGAPTYLLNGEEFKFLLPVVVGHWENMRTEYFPYDPIYLNGEIYIPIQGLPGFTAENTN